MAKKKGDKKQAEILKQEAVGKIVEAAAGELAKQAVSELMKGEEIPEDADVGQHSGKAGAIPRVPLPIPPFSVSEDCECVWTLKIKLIKKNYGFLGIDSLAKDEVICQKSFGGTCPPPTEWDGKDCGHRYESDTKYELHWELEVYICHAAPLISKGIVKITVS